jgi:glucuronate isomerase
MAIIINGAPCAPMAWMKVIAPEIKQIPKNLQQWAATVPYTLRNPLYHWTHMELQRYFGVNDILNADSASKIYDTCTALIQTKEYSVKNLFVK